MMQRPARSVVTVPTHLVLHAHFTMATAAVGRSASSQLRQAARLSTVVELAEDDHDAAMEELARRADSDRRRRCRAEALCRYYTVLGVNYVNTGVNTCSEMCLRVVL